MGKSEADSPFAVHGHRDAEVALGALKLCRCSASGLLFVVRGQWETIKNIQCTVHEAAATYHPYATESGRTYTIPTRTHSVRHPDSAYPASHVADIAGSRVDASSVTVGCARTE